MPRIMVHKPKPLLIYQRSNSDLSTVSTTKDNNYKNIPPTSPRSRRRRRPRVHFHQVAKVYTVPRVNEDQVENVWYSSDDLNSFHEQAQELVDFERQKKENPWAEGLLQVYCLFRGQVSREHLNMILQSRSIQIDESNAGLEEAAIPEIAEDFQLRRQHLMEQVRRLQGLAIEEHIRAQMICDTSCLTSRVSRLFAGYVAHVAMQNDV